jgi:hypothetical protein
LHPFVWLSGLRWAIEQCFEEGKTDLGMDHESPQICRLAPPYADDHAGAFLFVAPEAAFGEKAPALTVSQLRTLLDAVLQLRTATVNDILELLAWVQRRNHSAYLSHRKRRESEG